MIILVTGAAGFIGRRLIRSGEQALVRRPMGLESERVGDLLNFASLVRACEGVETVFHCASLADALAGDAEDQWRVNVEGTRNLLAAAVEAGVKRFVFLSSIKAMAEPGSECVGEDWPGEPSTAYGQSKRAAEEAVLEAGAKYGMHVVNLRLAPVYGAGSRGNLWRLAQAVRRGWFPRLPQTHNRRSIVHVQDVVEVVRLVAQRPEANGRTYIIADPQPYSTFEIVEAMRAVLHAPALWRVPVWALRAAGYAHPRLQEAIQRLMGSACYSPARIERELGWRARVGLAEGMREMLEPGAAPSARA